ncbi:MAG: glycosyltransferase family 1 protein [Patescibacteria group bacterium]|nr:glycosyltransferase family 1 protein [Patescibacteria group bacterium]
MIIGIEAARPNRPQKTGTEWYGYHVIQEIKKIADPSDRFILYTNDPLRSGLEIMPNANWREKRLGWPIPKFWTQGRLSLEMLVNSPDAVFIPAHAMPIIHVKNTVVTLHDVGFERFPELYSRADLWYHRWSAKFIIRHAAKIITVSNFSKNELVELYGAPAEKIFVTHLGYDAERYRVIEPAEVEKVLLKHRIKTPYIFYIGRLERKKNIPLLIEAFGRFKQKNQNDSHSLVLVGRPGFDYEKIQENIKKFNLEQWVIQTGWVGEDSIPYFYNGAAAFVFPSRYEGFGIPLIEAMACGTPILASRAGSIPEVAADAALYFETESADSLIAGMENILNNQELRGCLRAAGLARCQNFSWARTARQTLEILKSNSRF